MVKKGAHGSQLAQINRAWKHQEVLFVSDIATANNRGVDLIYTEDWKISQDLDQETHRSQQYQFVKEHPTSKDWDQRK